MKRLLCAALCALLFTGCSLVANDSDNWVPIVSGTWELTTEVSFAEIPFVELKGHASRVHTVCFSPDGKKIVTSSDTVVYSDTYRVWDVESGKELYPLTKYFRGFSPDGKKILLVDDWRSNKCRILDAESGKELHVLSGGDGGFSPDGKKIFTNITNDGDTIARIWDTESGKGLYALTGFYVRRFVLDGKKILAFGGEPPGCRIFDAESGEELRALPDDYGWYSDNKIVTRTEDYFHIWDVGSGKELYSLPNDVAAEDGYYSSIHYMIKISPDGKKLIAKDGVHTRIFDAKSGKELWSALDDGIIGAPAFSPDGKKAILNNRSTSRIFEADSGKELYSLQTNEWGVYFSWDGTKIASPGNYVCRILNAESGKELNVLPGVFKEFSPDGKRVVTASNDNTARIWDISALTQEDNP